MPQPETSIGTAGRPLAPVSLMGGWCDPTESLPPTLQPVIVYGVLDGESTPDSHEGYWNGDLWKSIRRNEDDHHLLDIEPVMLWTPMPKPPIADISDRLSGGKHG